MKWRTKLWDNPPFPVAVVQLLWTGFLELGQDGEGGAQMNVIDDGALQKVLEATVDRLRDEVVTPLLARVDGLLGESAKWREVAERLNLTGK